MLRNSRLLINLEEKFDDDRNTICTDRGLVCRPQPTASVLSLAKASLSYWPPTSSCYEKVLSSRSLRRSHATVGLTRGSSLGNVDSSALRRRIDMP